MPRYLLMLTESSLAASILHLRPELKRYMHTRAIGEAIPAVSPKSAEEWIIHTFTPSSLWKHEAANLETRENFVSIKSEHYFNIWLTWTNLNVSAVAFTVIAFTLTIAFTLATSFALVFTLTFIFGRNALNIIRFWSNILRVANRLWNIWVSARVTNLRDERRQNNLSTYLPVARAGIPWSEW